MLTAEQIAALRDYAERLTDPINDYLIRDIAERIAKAGQFTATAQYQIWAAQQMGLSQAEIKKRLKKLLGVSNDEIKKLLTQSAEVGYRFDLKALPTADAIPFTENHVLQEIVSAAVKLAQDDFTNITQTIGMVDPYGRALPLQQAYRNSMDFAFSQVATGAADYNTAVRLAVKNLAEKGIQTIDYQSGIHTSLEAAVRRSVMGGLGLMQEQISKQTHDDLGANGWEISAHAASAPDHEPIQGKQYSDEEYETLNNSLVRRIGTLNCGHAAFPIILGVTPPQYTQEELEKYRLDNERGIDYAGKHYTMYEATQRQRRLEASMRRQKWRILADEATGDTEKLQQDQIKLQVLNQEYRRFSKAAGLRAQDTRAEVLGFGGKQGVAAGLQRDLQQSNTAYTDATKAWYEEATPNSHPVSDLRELTIDGNTYRVDGRNVVLDYSAHEKEIAELLEKEFGGEMQMVPRINNPQGISTPDYLFRGERYDLKTIGKTTGKNPLFNRIKNAKGQAENFVLDITNAKLEQKFVDEQLGKVFWSNNTKYVKKIILVRDGRILKIVVRA